MFEEDLDQAREEEMNVLDRTKKVIVVFDVLDRPKKGHGEGCLMFFVSSRDNKFLLRNWTTFSISQYENTLIFV